MRRRLWAILGAALLTLPSPIEGQEPPRVSVRVRQVAGSSVYLDIGTRHGLATGDTVRVAVDSAGPPVGVLTVTASTETRSVLTFAEAAFPVTRGMVLTLYLERAPVEAPPSTTLTPAPAGPPTGASDQGRGRVPPTPELQNVAQAPERYAARAHGRVAMDMSAIRSVTTIGGSDPLEVDRTFATPALRFDVTAPEAVGGFTLRTSARLAYRYSDGTALEPAMSARVYAASLERDFTTVPLQVVLGRFYSPVEQYSGVWDGAFVRVGRDAVGAGAIVGFEPDRWNERPSTQLPKVTAFVDGRARGAGWRWQGNVSAHMVRPADSVPNHTFVGATQRISLGPLFLSHDVQVDRDPADAVWRVSRLRVRAALDLSSAVSLRGGFARRESYVLGRLSSPFGPRNDRIEGGVAIRAGRGFLSADASRSEDVSGQQNWGYTGAFATGPLPGPGELGLSGSVSRWTGPYGSSLSAAPGLDLGVGGARVRLGYRYSRSDYLDRTVLSHGLDASLDAPFGSGLGLSVRSRLQWGGLLRSQGLDLTLYRIF